MDQRRKLRLSLGGMMVVVAVIAIGITALRPKGTTFRDLKVGTGPAVKVGDTISVQYVGKLANGLTFDDSRRHNGPAFEDPIGRGMAIKGWDAGILGMRVGGVRQIIIPPDEGYGENGVGPIPPNSTLYFEVELLGIK